MTRSTWRPRRGVVALAAWVFLGCDLAPAQRPGIALITIEGWRADATGFLGGLSGLTPNLDRLASTADWAGAAIAPASASAPALASVLTGVGPWRHRVLTRFDTLPAPAITLAEALAERGYQTRAFRGKVDIPSKGGFSQGITVWSPLREGRAARAALTALAPGEFVWIHVSVATAEYRRRDAYLARLPPGLVSDDAPLPTRLRRGKAMLRHGPASPPSAELRSQLRALYLTEVARTDELLGELLRAWEQGPAPDRSVLAVVATRGEELGENGEVGDGQSLGRGAIEVPLVVALPRAGRAAGPVVGALASRPASGTHRLWATLLHLAGGQPPPGVEAGLFEPDPPGVLSELYGESGRNQFSWIDAEGQYLRTVRYADWNVPKSRTPRGVRLERRRRQLRAFRQTLPWSGAAGARIDRRWVPLGAVEPAAATAGAELDRRDAAARGLWLLFSGPEMTPADRAVLY